MRLIIIMTVVGIISCLLLLIGAAVGYAIDDEIGLPIGVAVMCIFISVMLRGYKEILFILSALLFRRKKQPGTLTGRNDTETASGTFFDFDKSQGIQKHPLVRGVFYIIIVSSATGGFILHHDKTYNNISSICRSAHSATSLDQRKSFLQEAYEIPRFGLFISGKTWMGSDPIGLCDEVREALDRLLVWGECSEYVLKDVPCKCGEVDWSPDNPPEKCTRFGSKNPRCVEDWGTRELKIKC